MSVSKHNQPLVEILEDHGVNPGLVRVNGLSVEGYWSNALDAEGSKVYEEGQLAKTFQEWPDAVLRDDRFEAALYRAMFHRSMPEEEAS